MFLCHRVNGVNLKVEAVSAKAGLKNKHWICRINLVFIHRSNNSSWFCRYYYYYYYYYYYTCP